MQKKKSPPLLLPLRTGSAGELDGVLHGLSGSVVFGTETAMGDVGLTFSCTCEEKRRKIFTLSDAD